MRKGGPHQCVDQDTSDFGVHASYLTLSILSRKDLIDGGFLSAPLRPFHILTLTVPAIYLFICLSVCLFLVSLITALLRYHSHALLFTCSKVYTSMAFSIFTNRCNHYHNPF